MVLLFFDGINSLQCAWISSALILAGSSSAAASAVVIGAASAGADMFADIFDCMDCDASTGVPVSNVALNAVVPGSWKPTGACNIDWCTENFPASVTMRANAWLNSAGTPLGSLAMEAASKPLMFIKVLIVGLEPVTGLDMAYPRNREL